MKFNENLKYLRKQANLTQEQLAEKLNVSRQAVTKWESGEGLPDIENLKEIAHIFSVSTDALIGDIQCKGENKIKRKVNDLGWFIFAFAIIIIDCIISCTTVIQGITEDEGIIGISTMALIFIAFMILAFELKLYFRDNKKIIDMTETEKGKKYRRNIRIKESAKIFVAMIIYSFVSNLYLVLESISTFFNGMVADLVPILAVISIFEICKYKKLEKEVKKLNETK